MSNIDTINVGGLDYPVEDAQARRSISGIANITAYEENGSTASRAYAVLGTPINWKGALYYTIATIAEGATLTENVNVVAGVNIGVMLTNIKTYVGEDGKLHFVDATGADSVLPFSGGVELVYLGTGTSFNVSSHEGYENFTTDNFICEVASTSTVSVYTWGNTNDAYAYGTFSKSYNASTGVLTSSYNVRVVGGGSNSANQSVKAYLKIE